MIVPNPTFGNLTRFHLARQIEAWGWQIGRHTYGHPLVLEPELARLRIGHFCSIGPGVTLVLGNHRTDLVTTYPFQALREFWPDADAGEKDHDTRGDIVIHSDVWLAAHCTVLSGVTIGAGAVVAAGALVRADVPPYAVVAGNPARIVRHRFDEATVARLLRVAWWDWPDPVIAARLGRLLSRDVDAFLEEAEAPGA